MNLVLPTIEPPKRDSLFLNSPTKENLILDLKIGALDDLLLTPIDLDDKKKIVLALSHRINYILDYYKAECVAYKEQMLLNEFRYFILIADKSLSNFKLKVQFLFDDELTVELIGR